jgi:predicted DsbA family dithiol-disulfide isomerase
MDGVQIELEKSKDGRYVNDREEPNTANIEVFADIWCPFAHVGLRAVDEQRQIQSRGDVGIVVRSWPLELINGAPMDPVAVLHHVHELREQVAPDLFQHFDITHFPNSTLEALALVVRAYRVGTAVGERMSFALRDALFEHGQDISDPTVLRAVADGLDVALPDENDRAAVRRDWEDGRRRGVLGSPHFFFGEQNVFCPSLTIARNTDSGLWIQRTPARLIQFLDLCFRPSESFSR